MFEAREVKLAAKVSPEQGTPEAGSSMVKLLVRDNDEAVLKLCCCC